MSHSLPYTTDFSKSEKLCSKKLIEELFTKGSSVYLYPFRLHWLPRTDSQVAYPQLLFSVSKKNFKRANKRNLVRRRLREIYRLHKHEMLANLPLEKLPLCIGVIYIAKEILPSDVLEKKFAAVWKRVEGTNV